MAPAIRTAGRIARSVGGGSVRGALGHAPCAAARGFRVTVGVAGSAGGVVGGLEIGGGDFDRTTFHDEGTQYVGQVAEIGRGNPTFARYGFGLFACYQEPDDPNTPPFEVLNCPIEDF